YCISCRSFLETNVQPGSGERALASAVGEFLEMPDVGRGNGGGAGEDAVSVVRVVAHAAAGDDRDAGGRGHRSDQIEIVPGAGAVTIDTLEEDFPGSEAGGLHRPVGRLAAGRLSSAVDHDLVPAIFSEAGVDTDDDRLCAEQARTPLDQRWRP